MAKGKNAKQKTVDVKAKQSSRKVAAVDGDDADGAVADDAAPVASAKGSGKGKAAGKSAGPSRKTKAVAAPSGKASKRGGPAKGQVGVCCRDCGFEFLLDAGRARDQETITCTVCEHRAQAPSDDILHQISLYKDIEHRSIRLALIFLVVGIGAMAFWSVATASESRAQDSLFFFAPIGVFVISILATLVFGAKYERSRWETYF